MSNKIMLEQIDIGSNINVVNTLIQNLIEKDKISFSEVIGLLREKRKEEKVITFPLSILRNRSIGILEATTKYMKEELNLKYHEIAALLNRDARPIWTTYNKAKCKFPNRFVIDKNSIYVPVSIFTNRKLGLLENLAKHLKDNLNLKYREIADMLNRDNRTIWACYNQAIKKMMKTNNENESE